MPGWKTDRKIIVLESDDWGSLRMPSKSSYNNLLSQGLRVDLCPYNKFDTLESSNDLTALYDVFSKFKDFKGNHPVLTANVNPVNPDFEAIKKSGFQDYSYEVFTDSYKRYYPSENVFGVMQEGISKGFIFPQYHHREHISPLIWMELLRKGNSALLKAFEEKTYGLSFVTSPEIKVPYLGSLLFRNSHEFEEVSKAIIDGANIFEKIFGFRAKSFIAPLYLWDSSLEVYLKNAGIDYIQGADVHRTYDFESKKFKRAFHAVGSKNSYGQIYLNRNCVFEPSISGNLFNLEKLFKEIETSFYWKKPAVLTTHRLNYIGGLDEGNRSQNLKYLEILIDKLLKKWPDVEFMHSSQLGDLITE